MAINHINYAGIEPLRMGPGVSNIFAKMLEGYKMAKEPEAMDRQKLKEELLNRRLMSEAEHAPEYYGNRAKNAGQENLLNALKYDILQKTGLRQAEADIESTGRQHTYGGGNSPDIVKLQHAWQIAKETYGDDSPEAQQLEDIINKKTGSSPTGATRTQNQQRQIFNKAREYIASNVDMPETYKGTGASVKLLKDIGKYKTTKNPEEKQKLYDSLTTAFAASRIVPEYAMVQVGAQGNKLTVHAGKEQEKAIKQGWPTFGETIMDQAPSELIEGGKRKHDLSIAELNKITGNEFANILKPGNKRESVKEVSSEMNSRNSESRKYPSGGATIILNGVKYKVPAEDIDSVLEDNEGAYIYEE